MNDQSGQEGGTPDPAAADRPQGDRRPSRGDRRGRGRRRRGAAQQPEAGGAARPPRQPAAARQDKAAPASLVAFLARAGVGSRRRCDEMVRAGHVTVNGEAVDFPRQKLDPSDVVAVDGATVEARGLRYVLLNKPRGVASTRRDPHAERVVVDLVPDGRVLFPVGRLDVDTTGIIVLTNDGPLAHRLMHPSYGVPKTYVVRVRGRVGRRELSELRAGVELEDGITAPADARLVKQSGKTALVELTIHQGRKRQVRRMFAALGLHVDDLQRRRYGPLGDAGLAVGEWRELSEEEVDALRRAAEHVETCVGREPEEEAVRLAAEEKPSEGSGESSVVRREPDEVGVPFEPARQDAESERDTGPPTSLATDAAVPIAAGPPATSHDDAEAGAVEDASPSATASPDGTEATDVEDALPPEPEMPTEL